MQENAEDHGANERLNITLDNLNLIAYEIDREGQWILSRGGGLEKLGRKPDEVVGQSYFEYYRNQPEIIQAMQRALEGQRQVLEIEVGGRIWHSTYVPCKGADGTVESVFGTAFDITDYKRTNERLALEKKAHERTRYLLDSRNQILELMATGIDLKIVLHKLIKTVEAYVPEVRGSIFLVDPRRKRLCLGAAPSLPDYFNQAVDRTPIQMGLGCCGTAAFTGKRTIAEKIAIHPYWVSVRGLAAKAGLEACWSEPIYSSDRKVLGTFAFYLSEPRGPIQEEIELISQSADIAGIAIERDRAEKAMRVNMGLQQVRIEILHMENEEDWFKVGLCFQRELKKVMRFNKSAIILVDLIAGQYTAYNTHEGKMLAQVFDEVPLSLRQVIETGMPLYRKNRQEIVAHLDRVEPAVMSVVDVPFQGGTIAINALEEYAFEAEEIAVLEHFAPVLSEAYRRLEDLQTLRQKETQLRQSQKMQAIGQLTAGIAHNFNNRLMVISTAVESQLLIGSFDLEQLKRIESSVDQAAKMVDQLMLFSSSNRVLDTEPIQVERILSDTLEMGRKTFDRKIVLINEIPRDLLLISGDITQLEQVFLNLLLNARDAVEESNASSPSIRMAVNMVSFEDEALPADLVSRQRNYLRIDVIDNGMGMNEETQQRVFEPFFTTKEVDKGTGLGLATVYAIIQDHQGWIECESQVGVGTTFSVYLPVAEQEIVTPVVEQPQTIPRGTETILFIEDEGDLRDQQVSVFEQYGYEVLVGTDGQEGWETFEREWEHVDVVLLDLSLPNVSGQEILSRMLTLNPDVKVIISTGYTQHRADALGAKALLKKPYRLTQALQTIRKVLDGGRE